MLEVSEGARGVPVDVDVVKGDIAQLSPVGVRLMYTEEMGSATSRYMISHGV